MSALLVAPLAPLVAAAVIALLGRRGLRPAASLVIVALVISLAAALSLLAAATRIAVPWLEVPGFSIELALVAAPLPSAMAVLVAALCLLVGVYAVSYLGRDRRRHIFFAWLGFFAAAMVVLVLADSLVLLLVAWEAVGVASYALIAFHRRQRAPRRAAAAALVVTRAGDLALLLAALLLLVAARTDELGAIAASADAGRLSPSVLTAAAWLLLGAALAKSAQLPLSAWLTRAMVAPTPVSALLHSATMVAAGVLLAVRLFPIFAAAPSALEGLVWLGAATALAGAVAAAAAGDLKRVLAYSTISQLGEMLLAAGHHSPGAAALHLGVHATFKACLFVVAGVIEQGTGTRKLSELGGLRRSLPGFAAIAAVAALSLAGVPPLAGFASQSALLGAAASAGAGWVVFEIAVIALAGLYIGRAVAAVFLRWPGAPAPAVQRPGPAPLIVAGILALGAVSGPLVPAIAAPAGEAIRVAGAVAAASGLGLGALWGWRVGPAPLPGAARLPIGRALEAALAWPAAAARAAAAATLPVERWLDRAARAAGRGAATAAASVAAVDRRGLGAAGDRAAVAVADAGSQLRRLESGRLTLYAAGLFGAVAAAALLAVLAAL